MRSFKGSAPLPTITVVPAVSWSPLALARVYLLRENPLGPGRQHTRLDFMAGRLGPGVGVRFGWVAAQGAGFAFGGGQGGVGRGSAGEREAVRASWASGSWEAFASRGGGRNKITQVSSVS